MGPFLAPFTLGTTGLNRGWDGLLDRKRCFWAFSRLPRNSDADRPTPTEPIIRPPGRGPVFVGIAVFRRLGVGSETTRDEFFAPMPK